MHAHVGFFDGGAAYNFFVFVDACSVLHTYLLLMERVAASPPLPLLSCSRSTLCAPTPQSFMCLLPALSRASVATTAARMCFRSGFCAAPREHCRLPAVDSVSSLSVGVTLLLVVYENILRTRNSQPAKQSVFDSTHRARLVLLATLLAGRTKPRSWRRKRASDKSSPRSSCEAGLATRIASGLVVVLVLERTNSTVKPPATFGEAETTHRPPKTRKLHERKPFFLPSPQECFCFLVL